MIVPSAASEGYEIPTIDWDASTGDLDFDPSRVVDEESVVTLATRLALALPCAGDLLEFAARPSPGAALLVRNVPIGEIGATPASPGARPEVWTRPELLLLAAARLLGHPIGYAPEHGGRLVQDIVPVKGTERLQVSTSSSGDLMFHTETAFHPHRPRHLLLLCLRGEPGAATTLLSVGELIEGLDESVIEILHEPRFATAVDLSFLGGRRNLRGEPHRILDGPLHDPTLLFDADLTVGLDEDASQAVAAVNERISNCHRSLVLEAGDLLVVDNARAVHGRSSYQARFDGTDRWLMRAFTVADLCLSTADRQGRIITTIFGDA
jgi:L-asparagine oxygenase